MKRNVYSEKAVTAIWREEPEPDNPYLARTCRLFGYDLLDLVRRGRFVDTLFLLFRGELPDAGQARLLEALMVYLVNPGPRDAATRAAMLAGVSKAGTEHLLPIGLMAMGGEYGGAREVEAAMRFLAAHRGEPVPQVAAVLLARMEESGAGDRRVAPGFGSLYGGIDGIARSAVEYLTGLPGAGEGLRWGDDLARALAPHHMGWLRAGVAAAVFADLGIGAREGAGLFQLLGAPGVLAHGLEQTHKPITAMPMLGDEDYVIER